MANAATRPDPSEDRPSDATILHRALTFAFEGLQAADVQLERARQDAPDRPGGAFLWWIDLQFFIVAMRRLRRGAELAMEAEAERNAMRAAISAFDAAVPELRLLRDVGEHIDDYAVGKGFNPSVRWRSLQVGAWDGETLEWLDIKLNAESALAAGRKLVGEIEWARMRVLDPERFDADGREISPTI
jgi:hypothetical protein